MDVYNPVRVYADKSVRYDARPNVPGQTQCHEALHATFARTARNRSRLAFARSLQSHALAVSRARCLTRAAWSHAATQACRQNCRDDRGRVVVEN